MTDRSNSPERRLKSARNVAENSRVTARLELLNRRWEAKDLSEEDLASALKLTEGLIVFEPTKNPPFRRVFKD